jgi:hypothetical protein
LDRKERSTPGPMPFEYQFSTTARLAKCFSQVECKACEYKCEYARCTLTSLSDSASLSQTNGTLTI